LAGRTAPFRRSRREEGGLWSGAAPLVLASRSSSRRALLTAAGLSPEIIAADVDERTLERDHLAGGGSLENLASRLAMEKALVASARRPGAYCLGADQTLIVEGRVLHKSADLAEAARSLAALQGRTHCLISAFCVARWGQAMVVEADHADLTMRPLDANAIARYLDLAGMSALLSVGVYRIEGFGLHLFDRIDGDFATILGIPMLRLLAWLRRENLISL
jgi:septum formation protein